MYQTPEGRKLFEARIRTMKPQSKAGEELLTALNTFELDVEAIEGYPSHVFKKVTQLKESLTRWGYQHQ